MTSRRATSAAGATSWPARWTTSASTWRGLEALDVGASTGGFTDALLQRGAAHVTALDVGYGQIAWKLRGDPRVTVVERTNFRTLRGRRVPGRVRPDRGRCVVHLAAHDRRARGGYLRERGAIVALVKPQFEAGRERLGGGGVVRDPAVHAAILREVRDGGARGGVRAVAATVSPLRGPAGNAEFFYRLARDRRRSRRRSARRAGGAGARAVKSIALYVNQSRPRAAETARAVARIAHEARRRGRALRQRRGRRRRSASRRPATSRTPSC